jgi:hypothetical protein
MGHMNYTPQAITCGHSMSSRVLDTSLVIYSRWYSVLGKVNNCCCVISSLELTPMPDNSIHIWDHESGATVHRIPAEVQVRNCRRAIAWTSTSADTLSFVSAGEKELKFWSTAPANPQLASSLRPSLSTLAVLTGLPTPGSQELIAKDMPPLAHSSIDMQIQEVGRVGQDADSEKVISMDGGSEKAHQDLSGLPTTT